VQAACLLGWLVLLKKWASWVRRPGSGSPKIAAIL